MGPTESIKNSDKKKVDITTAEQFSITKKLQEFFITSKLNTVEISIKTMNSASEGGIN